MKKLIFLITFLFSAYSFALECSFYRCNNAKCDKDEINRKFQQELTVGENYISFYSADSNIKKNIFVLLTAKQHSLEIMLRQYFETHRFSTAYPRDASVFRYVYNQSMGGKTAEYAIECK